MVQGRSVGVRLATANPLLVLRERTNAPKGVFAMAQNFRLLALATRLGAQSVTAQFAEAMPLMPSRLLYRP